MIAYLNTNSGMSLTKKDPKITWDIFKTNHQILAMLSYHENQTKDPLCGFIRFGDFSGNSSENPLKAPPLPSPLQEDAKAAEKSARLDSERVEKLRQLRSLTELRKHLM